VHTVTDRPTDRHDPLLSLFAVVANADVLLDIVAEVKNRERELSELLGCVHVDLYSNLSA